MSSKHLKIDLIIKLPENKKISISSTHLQRTLNDILQMRFPLFEVEIDKIYIGKLEGPTLAEKLFLLKEPDED